MSKFVLLAADNRAAAFYDSGLNAGAIPAGALAISDALWESWIGQTATVVYVAATQTLAPYVAPSPPAPTQTALQAALVAAAISASVSITTQINKTETHAAAFYNVSAIVAANGGSLPTTGALAESLAALATVYGGSTAALATMSDVLQKASFDNLAALAMLEAAAGSATTTEQLGAALAAFEASIAAVVAEINAVLTIPIMGPAAISIVGISGR